MPLVQEYELEPLARSNPLTHCTRQEPPLATEPPGVQPDMSVPTMLAAKVNGSVQPEGSQTSIAVLVMMESMHSIVADSTVAGATGV